MYEKKIEKDSDDFWHWKLTLKIRFLHFLLAIFGHLKRSHKKIKSIFCNQSNHTFNLKCFLSNSVNMMKNLTGVYKLSIEYSVFIYLWLWCFDLVKHDIWWGRPGANKGQMLIFTRPGIPAFCDTSKQKETSMITNRQLVKENQRNESQCHCKQAFSLEEQSSHECHKF